MVHGMGSSTCSYAVWSSRMRMRIWCTLTPARIDRVHDISRDLSFAPRARAPHTLCRVLLYTKRVDHVSCWRDRGLLVVWWCISQQISSTRPVACRSSAEWQKLPQICVNLVPSIAHFHLCCFPTINPQKYMRSKYLKNHTLISR